MTFGHHYNDGSGTYARNPPSQLSANSDSDGNNIPYGEWHKIHMPNSIILRTVNIAERNHLWPRGEGLRTSFLFMGVMMTQSGHY